MRWEISFQMHATIAAKSPEWLVLLRAKNQGSPRLFSVRRLKIHTVCARPTAAAETLVPLPAFVNNNMLFMVTMSWSRFATTVAENQWI
jgi:hypothetical protein